MLHFEVNGYELYSEHWHTKWKIGRQNIIYWPRYLNLGYVTARWQVHARFGDKIPYQHDKIILENSL